MLSPANTEDAAWLAAGASTAVATRVENRGSPMRSSRWTNLIGWTAVVLVTLAASFWAYWGVNEAFHEGWLKPQWWMRLVQVLAYLSPAALLCTFAVIAIRWPRVGAALFVLAGAVIAGLMIWDRAYLERRSPPCSLASQR
jgi:hypothetical protein